VTRLALEVLLTLAVLAAWLGCFGFLRLRSAMDRLHCAAFVNATTGTTLAVAAFVADGLSDRAFKVLLIAALGLVSGAAASHAIGRALLLRGEE
jgi:multisubunit Na+/H+ antiporter MnhG subunit